MRQYFSDLERLKRIARENLKSGIAGLKRWWSKKYKLPPNHELFIGQNVGDLNLEMFEDWMLRREELESILDDKNAFYPVEQVREMQKEIIQLTVALGEEKEQPEDDLIDKWERELDEGLTPDLNEGLNRV